MEADELFTTGTRICIYRGYVDVYSYGYISVLLLPRSIATRALENPGLLLSYSITTTSLHITTILTISLIFFCLSTIYIQIHTHTRRLPKITRARCERKLHSAAVANAKRHVFRVKRGVVSYQAWTIGRPQGEDAILR